MNALFMAVVLSVAVLSGYVTSEGRDSSGYGVGSNKSEQTTEAESPMLGAGVGRAVLGSGG